MTKAKIFLGIDGGGTKTAFILEVGDKFYEHIEKTLHLKQVSREIFLQRLKSGIESVCSKACVEVGDILYTFMAMPGFGQFPEDEDFILGSLEEILGSNNFKVGNDCVNGWAASLNATAGINLVLGTGSIGFGVDDKKNTLICGGWGPFIGDEASGYYIGKKILNIFSKMSDGRLEKTPLYSYVREEFNIKEDFDIITKALAMDRDEIAALAKVLPKCLKDGDKNALTIIDDVSKEASLIINTLVKRLDFERDIKVSYSGGVFKLGDVLLGKIKEYVDDRVKIVAPFASPSVGSLILAKNYYEKGDMM